MAKTQERRANARISFADAFNEIQLKGTELTSKKTFLDTERGNSQRSSHREVPSSGQSSKKKLHSRKSSESHLAGTLRPQQLAKVPEEDKNDTFPDLSETENESHRVPGQIVFKEDIAELFKPVEIEPFKLTDKKCKKTRSSFVESIGVLNRNMITIDYNLRHIVGMVKDYSQLLYFVIDKRVEDTNAAIM